VLEVQKLAIDGIWGFSEISIEQASVTADAVEATTQESKRIWNLP
jgi:hypothetical protein